MTGSYSFTLSSSKIIFKIELHRNVTVLRGEGATYKTLFCHMIHDAGRIGSGVHLKSPDAKVVYLDDRDFSRDHLAFYRRTNSILVFDEDSLCVNTKEFRKAITDTGCYFILITRTSCSEFGVSTKEMFEFDYDDTLDLNKRTVYMKPIYQGEFFGSYKAQKAFLTEDEKSGHQFFKQMYPECSVISAKGKDNIAKIIPSHPNSIIIVDGAAFGFEMKTVYSLLEEYNCFLIAKESFEYCTLCSGILTLPANVDLKHPVVDSTQFLTWENYFTELLESLTKGTRMLYSKSRLNPAYITSGNGAKILALYKPDNEALVSDTSFFSEA